MAGQDRAGQGSQRPGLRLSRVLVEIASLVGEARTLSLVEQLGGQEIWVPEPERLEPGHPLVMALGLEHARRFCARYAGPKFIVPTGIISSRPRGDIDPMIAEGLSGPAIVRRAGRHIRTVHRRRRLARLRGGC